MTNLSLSPWSEAILDTAKSGQNCIVKARAGCGKSTNLKLVSKALANQGTQNQIFLAFNKHNAAALKGQIPAECKTIHSLGMALLRQYFGSLTVSIDKSARLHKLCKLPGRLLEFQRGWELFRLLGHDIDSAEQGWIEVDGMVEDDVTQYIDYTDVLVDTDLGLIENDGVIDYADMIWSIPHLIDSGELSAQGVQLLMLDEAQDASGASIKFIEHVLNQNLTQFIAVGDDLQSIFGWAGAGKNNLPTLQGMFNAPAPLLLPVTYRCPSNVAKVAQTFCPDLEYHRTGGTVTYEMCAPGEFPDDSLVIARTYGELIPEFFPRRMAGENVVLRGHGFVEKASRSVLAAKRQKKHRNSTYFDVLSSLQADREQKVARLPRTLGAENRRRMLQSEIDTFKAFSSHFGSYEEMYEFSARISEKRPGAVTFSSIHRCKGDENANVFFLGYKDQYDAAKAGDIEALKTTYVGVTRSSNSLTLVLQA